MCICYKTLQMSNIAFPHTNTKYLELRMNTCVTNFTGAV